MQHFSVEQFDRIEDYLKQQSASYSSLLEQYPLMEQLLRARNQEQSNIPKLQIFEGDSGIKQFFRDMLYELKQKNIKEVRMLASNTFEERLGDASLATYAEEFYTDIQAHNISLDVFEATGSLIPERLKRSTQRDFDPSNLPAARGTTNMFVIGNIVYIACYHNSPIGLKIDHLEISQIFHFLFDFIGKRIEG